MSAKPRSPALLVAAVIVLIAVAPFISVLTSAVLAGVLGCEVDEGSIHPCQFMGVDLGEILYFMAVLGWLGLLTLPAGALALWVWQMLRS